MGTSSGLTTRWPSFPRSPVADQAPSATAVATQPERPGGEAAQSGVAHLYEDGDRTEAEEADPHRAHPLFDALAPATDGDVRLAVVHDVRGPRIRRGVLWFAVVVLAGATSTVLLALVLALAAALAADEVVRLQAPHPVPEPERPRRHRQAPRPVVRAARFVADPRRLPPALAAGALPIAATAGADAVALTAPLVVLVIVGHRLWTGARSLVPADGAIAVTAALVLGGAAAAPVLVARLGPAAAVVLVVLVCAYDAGDFLVGADASSIWEGPVAGAASVGVAAFAASVVALPPLTTTTTLALGGATALLAPLGTLATSALLGGGARHPSSYVRRLDSLVVLGPVAAWTLASALG